MEANRIYKMFFAISYSGTATIKAISGNATATNRAIIEIVLSEPVVFFSS